MELFRVIVDHKTIKAFHLHQFDPDDFMVYNNQYQLRQKAVSKYYAEYVKEMMKYREDIFLFIRDCYRAFMKEKPIDKYPWFELC